jgi:hypothetical protein
MAVPSGRRHVCLLLRAVESYLPDDIETVHDWGCGLGGGVKYLQTLYPDVKGFDVEQRWEHAIIGDATDPQEDADLIVTCHMFEKAYGFDTVQAIEALLDHCRYLAISVYTAYSKLKDEYVEPYLIIKSEEEVSIESEYCYPDDEGYNKRERTHYLLKGRL